MTERLPERLAGQVTERLAERLAGRVTERLAGRLAGRGMERLAGRMAGWLVVYIFTNLEIEGIGIGSEFLQ